MPIDALILAVAGLAVFLSVLSLTRSAPATLRTEAEEARSRSLRAEEAVNSMTVQWEAARAALNSTLGEMAEERERALKAFSRARAAQQRAEAGANGPPVDESRSAKLDRLRRESGILGSV